MRVDEYNDFSSLLARYRHAILIIEDIGVRISSSSRWCKYERLLHRVLEDPRPAIEEDTVFALAFYLREIDEIIEIVNHLPNPSDSGTINLLGKLIGGSELPDKETSSAAREAQYELYLGAVLRSAGITAHHGAPDLTATWRGQDFFIEAKRPSSAARFEDRLRSAIHQIRKLPSPGVIAFSLDQVVRSSGHLLSFRRFEDVALKVAQLVQKFVQVNALLWRKRLIGEQVAAILMTARIPGRLIPSGHLVLGSNLHVEPLLLDSSSTSQFIEQAVAAYIKAQK